MNPKRSSAANVTEPSITPISKEAGLTLVRSALNKGKKGAAKVKSAIISKAFSISSTRISAEQKFVPQFNILSRPGTFSETIFGWALTHNIATAINLTPAEPVEFSIHGFETGLVGIHLYFGTHNRKNSCRIIVQVFVHDSSHTSLASQVEIYAHELADNAPYFFRFQEPILDTKDGITFRVFSPDSHRGNVVALWGSLVNRSSLRNNTAGIPHCVNKSRYSASVTPFAPVVRSEAFFPRYTASCFSEIHRETFVGWQGACLETRYLPVFGPIKAQISFISPENNLSKIVFSTVTYERSNTGSVDLVLKRKIDSEWREIETDSVPTALFNNNAPYEFEFDPIENSLGALFSLTISSGGATYDNCIAIVGTTVKKDSELYRKLEKIEDFVSATDICKSIGSPTLLYKKRLPALERLKTDPAGAYEFKALVVKEGLNQQDVWPNFCEVVDKNAICTASALLDRYHLVIISGIKSLDSIALLLELSRRLCIPIASYSSEPNSRASHLCDYELKNLMNSQTEPSGLIDGESLYRQYEKLYRDYRQARLPKISVISVLYNKAAEIRAFLQSLALQDYPGQIEILLIDDCSPDNTSQIVESIIADTPSTFSKTGRLPIYLIKNESNLGNCGSRNRALKQASGDISLIVDADCPLNSTCLSAHAAAHGTGDSDVVIGTHNLETHNRDPFEVLEELENDLLNTQLKAELQDPIVPPSFLNSITRNISIKRSFWTEDLFDQDFSYSKNPESGFGWEDVEMGYRLFKAGARFRYIKEAISVHISHPSSCDEGTKPARSLRNFRRLITKHSDLRFVARRWALETFEKIKAWIESNKDSPSLTDSIRVSMQADIDWLEGQFKPFSSVRKNFSARKGLRILSYRWHCPHQYELYKLPHHFSLVKFPEQTYTNSWEYDQRPLRSNVRFIDPSQVDPRDYDVAILHFDENSLFPENSNGVLGGGWGHAFKWLRDNCPLPMVAVCHGTAQFRGQYDPKLMNAEGVQLLEYERQEMVRYLGDLVVVCNSHHAHAEWRFQNSRVIWHGFDPVEFGPCSVGHGILTLGMAMKERPVYRGYGVYLDVLKNLPEEIKLRSLSVPRPSYDYETSTNEYAFAKFKNYNKCIRDHSVYFNPTMRSPMPRSRGEAMMAGLVSVSAASHDVELFIKNGINGFYSNDPAELAEYLTFLMRNEAICRSMGVKSRELASDIFNIDRYHRDWNQLLKDVVG